MERIYACIDLKSFYASCECVERGLDPLTTNLVVADSSRTEKTICLAVSPSLKKYGLKGRSRLFEVVSKVEEINKLRRKDNQYRPFKDKSYNDIDLMHDKNLELDYIVATPRMKLYMQYSAKIYNIYLKHLSKDDIVVYSIDEIFCDITDYLKYNRLTPRAFLTKIIQDVYKETGITATGGIGTNLYLAKVAMDIVAKHTKEDAYHVRIAGLNEMVYRKKLWNHTPITDFWRVGVGYKEKLAKLNIFTMGDLARFSLENEDKLYKIFGVNAETLIDHAWGYEPCTIKDIKNYKPMNNSISTAQVLHEPYDYIKTKLIVREMADVLSLDLVYKKLVTNQIVLTIGYDEVNVKENSIYFKELATDRYGRSIPKHAHGTINIDHFTSSSKTITKKILELLENIINKKLLVRRINITFCNVIDEEKSKNKVNIQQFNLFSDNQDEIRKKDLEIQSEKEEKKKKKTIINIKNKYGKNVILKLMDLEEGATTIDRNKQVGGHKG